MSFENRHVDDHALWIDPANTDHLFIGGDGGVFESWDRGQQWRHVQNLPVTQFYRVTPDNAVPLLRTPVTSLSGGATLFKPRDSWIFIPDARRGWGGKGDYGIGRYAADNPPQGAVFSYYLAEDVFSLKEQRRKVEKEEAARGEGNPYPAWEELSREDQEEAPSGVLTVRDSSGQIILAMSQCLYP